MKSSRHRKQVSSDPLKAALDALDQLDAVRRSPSGVTSHQYRQAFAAFVEQRGLLESEYRKKADEYSQILWRRYSADLAQQQTASMQAVDHRREPEPSTNLPGSIGRLKELTRRARVGTALHSPRDVAEAHDRGVETLSSRNGAPMQTAGGGREVIQTVDEISTPSWRTPGFAQRLHDARVHRGWGQQTLSRKSGLSQQYLSRLERGERRPSIEAVRAIAEALGVSTDELLGLGRPE